MCMDCHMLLKKITYCTAHPLFLVLSPSLPVNSQIIKSIYSFIIPPFEIVLVHLEFPCNSSQLNII